MTLRLLLVVFLFPATLSAQAPYVFVEYDLNPGPVHSQPNQFYKFNKQALFTASDSLHGHELWISDGSATGTRMLKDIYPGTQSSAILNFNQLNNEVFFIATDSVHGRELWVTDGTPVGTRLFRDFIPGKTSSMWSHTSAVLNNQLVFSSADTGTQIGSNLWITDGTQQGTQLVKVLRYVNFLTEMNGKLYFAGEDSNGHYGIELWVTDGTSGGTYMVKDINTIDSLSSSPQRFVALNGRMYFTADDGVNGDELWVTDGTTNGTYMVKDINPGITGSNAFPHTGYSGKLYFSANDGVYGVEVWSSDGTTNGTGMVKDIYAGSGNSNISDMVVYNGLLYFTARDSTHGHELWRTDGSANGTTMVKDIQPGTGPSGPWRMNLFNDKLFFSAREQPNDHQLFFTDGTDTGTKMLRPTGPSIIPSLQGATTALIAIDSLLFIAGRYTGKGAELWVVSDTTAPLVNNVPASAPVGRIKVYPNPVRNELYVEGAGPANEVWIADINGRQADCPYETSGSGETIIFRTSHLQAGMYLIHCNDRQALFFKAD